MWLLDRLWPARPAREAVTPPPLPDAAQRRLLLKRPVRAGRTSMAPWQKVAAPTRRRSH